MLYDDQAPHYDERVGMPVDAARAVAAAIDTIVGLQPGTAVLEPGVGTGLVSIHLLRYPLLYVGFDRSAEMLGVFREKVDAAGLRAELVVADGNERWPVDDGSIDLVFSARALHHLDADHVVAELSRVLKPSGGWLVTGRVRRPQESVKSEMRRQMRRRLRERGFEGRSNEDHSERVFSALEARGARRIEPVTAARWMTRHRPSDSIASWQGKEGLGARLPPADVKSAVLDEVRAWAVERYGDIEQPHDQEEIFELSAIRI